MFSEEACLQMLFESRYSYSHNCGGGFRKLRDRNCYQCTVCKLQIYPCVGTVFEKATAPLTKWFMAVEIIKKNQKISCRELGRLVGVGYKTAWHMKKMIIQK